MADIQKALSLLAYLEHSGNVTKLLHKNTNEDGLTYFGIYEVAHPNWTGWKIVKTEYNKTGNLKEASVTLSKDKFLHNLVVSFYKAHFWDKAKLDYINSQKIANEVFLFGVNVGMSVSIKKAQTLIGAIPDGIVGVKTISKLNNYDEQLFDIQFDEKEKEYYDSIIQNKPYLSINKAGWYNRAEFC